MTEQAAGRLARSLLIAVIAMDGLAIVLTLSGGQVTIISFLVLPTLAYASVGSLIAGRVPGNAVGWLLCAGALAVSIGTLAIGSTLLFEGTPGFPFDKAAAWITVLVPYPIAAPALALSLLLFPDGRPASRWLRPAAWAAIAGGALLFFGYLSHPEQLGLSEFGLQGPSWTRSVPGHAAATGIGWGLVGLAGAGAVASILLRYRRSSSEERRALRLLARLLIALVAAVGVSLTGNWYALAAGFLIGGPVVLFGIPAALAVGVLKYRIYDIDLAIKKTIVAAAMVAFVVLAFLALVLLPATAIGVRSPDLWVLIPAAIVALGIGPVRRWARRGADRILYGERATPYEVLAQFSERVGETYSTEDVLPRMAQLLSSGTGATEARVWLRVGDELRSTAAWPADAPPAARQPIVDSDLPAFPGDAVSFPVRHQGELLGALTMVMPVSEPMNAAKERLARDLAGQAGLVLRNVRLIEDLRASRRRIVAAQDERARALERNIHDGAQQQLVALTVKLRLAEQLVSKDAEKAEILLAELQAETGDALENLRDLARGVYPPLLADRGLPAALEAQARKSPIPVSVTPDGVGRYPQEVETAVYFCCLEALQNVAKYAGATRATVRIRQGGGVLIFEVADDGRGFDPKLTRMGSGLQNMTDRLAALGGELEKRSAPETGTTITGRIPVPEGAG